MRPYLAYASLLLAARSPSDSLPLVVSDTLLGKLNSKRRHSRLWQSLLIETVEILYGHALYDFPNPSSCLPPNNPAPNSPSLIAD
jgi:hypothetical protein